MSWKLWGFFFSLLPFLSLSKFFHFLTSNSELDNPNLVKFFGIHIQDEILYLVTEFMNKGDLLDFLHKEIELSQNQLIKL